MKVSRVQSLFKAVLCFVILYFFLSLVVYFNRFLKLELFSPDSSSGNDIKKDTDIPDVYSSIINKDTKSDITVSTMSSVMIKLTAARNKKEKSRVVQLKDEIFPPGVKNYYNHPLNTINYFRRYTFDNPETYKGAFLDSWPPSKSRSIAPFMNEPFTMVPKKNKVSNKTLIVIVQSIPPEFDYRNIWRRTWGKYANKRTSVLFLLGKSSDISKEKELKIIKEQKKYGDIIQVDGLIENYNNLTFKSLYTLKFFLDKEVFSSETPPEYLLKIDTDNIVNLQKLYHQLTVGRYKNVRKLLLGCCYCCGGESDRHCPRVKPIEKPMPWKKIVYKKDGNRVHKKIVNFMIDPQNHPYKKWQIPNYVFNGSKYPSYLSGMGYVLSRGAAKCIFETALKTPFFPMEDIYITGFVAQECGVNRLDHIGFHSVRKKFDYETDLVNHRDCGDKERIAREGGSQKCYSELLYFASKYNSLLRNEM